MSVSRTQRRGAVLLEMLIAMALFVGAASMLSQMQTSIADSLERARLTMEATDLARKALAELEAGIITVPDLRTAHLRTEQSTSRQDRRIGTEDITQPSPWQVTVRTQRTEYAGLTLVELTMTHAEDAGRETVARDFAPETPANADDISITIRQLMRLRRDSGDDEGNAAEPQTSAEVTP